MQDAAKYPVGIQDFEKIRKEGYVYVDKTALIGRLVDTGCYYFLSRPRRFGKSLLLSTIAAYFSGRKDLFEGLALAEQVREWPEEHPVLYLDLGNKEYGEYEDLIERLDWNFKQWEQRYDITASDRSVELRFATLIHQAVERKQRQVVILIDEYDKPLLESVENEQIQKKYRSTLRAVYANLKTCDACIKFAMLTGVTKFSKVSIFSDLNNLDDISMNRRFAAICGITEEELEQDLSDGIAELAREYDISPEEVKNRLRKKYDGYRFSRNAVYVYNPFSLFKAMRDCECNDYWFATGTPSFLAAMMRRENFNLENLSARAVAELRLNAPDSLPGDPLPILFQSGYLTIDRADDDGNYYLRFPNEEVERGFLQVLMPYYAPRNGVDGDSLIASMANHVRSGKPDDFMAELRALLADTPYERSRAGEIYFRNLLFIVFRLLGFYCEVEHPTAGGRSDMVIKTERYIYVLELKVDRSADAALRQIEDKGYAAPYATDKRRLFKIGVNFSGEKKRIDEWRVVGA